MYTEENVEIPEYSVLEKGEILWFQINGVSSQF